MLPVVTLKEPVAAYIARLMRTSLFREVLQGEFHPHSRAQRGSSGARNLAAPCALRPALAPVVSYLGPAVAFIVTGSLVVETDFGLKITMGRLPRTRRDRPRLSTRAGHGPAVRHAHVAVQSDR